ncbi:MAG: hypothetical protein FWE53_05215 [Firmicutes bacterium]|nr:hypothetical protein [Bacillota bacterium]
MYEKISNDQSLALLKAALLSGGAEIINRSSLSMEEIYEAVFSTTAVLKPSNQAYISVGSATPVDAEVDKILFGGKTMEQHFKQTGSKEEPVLAELSKTLEAIRSKEAFYKAVEALFVLGYHLQEQFTLTPLQARLFETAPFINTRGMPTENNQGRAEWTLHGHITPKLNALHTAAEKACGEERDVCKRFEAVADSLMRLHMKAVKKIDDMKVNAVKKLNSKSISESGRVYYSTIIDEADEALEQEGRLNIFGKLAEVAAGYAKRYKDENNTALREFKNTVFGSFRDKSNATSFETKVTTVTKTGKCGNTAAEASKN